MNPFNILFLIIFFIPASYSPAFTLPDAWLAALNHSAEFSAARHSRDAEAEQKHQARAALLPQLSATADWRAQPSSVSADRSSRGWSVQASQVLFDQSRFAQYKQGKLAEEMADLRLEASRAELMMDVAQAYFDILLNQDKLAAVQSEKAAYAGQLERAREMFKMGAATVLDAYEAKSGYDTALAKEIDTLPDLLDETQETLWQDLAFRHNPEWQLQRKAAEDAAAALQAAKGARLPVISANGSYQDNRSVYRYGGFDHKYRSKGASFDIRLSMPLFSGGRISSQIREAVSREMQNKDLLIATERTAKSAVRQAFQTVKSSKIQALAQQRLLESNRAKLEATQLGRQVGVRNNLEEIRALQEKADAEQKLAEAKYAYIQAYLQLLQSAGVLADNGRIRRMGELLF